MNDGHRLVVTQEIENPMLIIILDWFLLMTVGTSIGLVGEDFSGKTNELPEYNAALGR